MRLLRTFAVIFLILACFIPEARASGQTAYHDEAAFTKVLKQLEKQIPDLSLTSAGKSHSGRDIWQMTLGDKDPNNQPALLVVGGLEGTDVASTEMLLNSIQQLAEARAGNEKTARKLRETVFYIFPRLNPDAAESFFEKIRAEKRLNSRNIDLDMDGQINEDGPDDLNRDGLITQMRVEDPEGQWLADTLITQLLRKADPEKGESGRYKLFSEGLDNDKDGVFNEDPQGGVDLNANFSFHYRFFKPGSGPHAVSEPETRLLVDFAFAHPNIAAVFCFSAQDNLNHPLKVEAKKPTKPANGRDDRKPLEKPLPEDAKYAAAVSKKFKTISGLTDAPKLSPGDGTLADWAYYHYGRWSFSTRAWWTPKIKVEKDSTIDEESRAGNENDNSAGATQDTDNGKSEKQETEKKLPRSESKDAKKEDPLQDQKNLWHWLKETGQDGFVEWTRVDHPDFPDQVVEVGGFKPFIGINPPVDSLVVLSEKYGKFLIELANLLPEISLKTKVESLSGNLYRITAWVSNEGFLPTSTKLGERIQWVRKVQVDLTLGEKQKLQSGQKSQRIDGLAGSGDTKKLSWIVVGDRGSRITIKAGSPGTGFEETVLNLK